MQCIPGVRENHAGDAVQRTEPLDRPSAGRDSMTGDVLVLDLTRGTARRQALPPGDEAIGGAGIAVTLVDEAIAGPIDPLGPDNVLAFGAGPFAATPVPAATKHAIATVSPLTGRLTDGLSSSHWSAALRRLGLAGILVRGTASRWTAVALDADGVRFLDASELCGSSAGETTERLRETLGDRRWRVAAIGVAGERGVRYATIDNDGRQAGRGGAGAVMGAKRLKAIALFAGDAQAPEPADPQRLRELGLVLHRRAIGPETSKYRILGTGANMRVLQRMGMLPTRNFGAPLFEGTERVSPERAREAPETYLEQRKGCAGCPVQCEHMYVRRSAGPKRASASEYESVWAFGPHCGVDDLDAVLDAIGRCDQYGLDTISTGAAIAFAMECASAGLVPADAFGTEALRFGNAGVLAPAIDAIAAKRGLGATLALGTRAAAAAIGRGAEEFAMHVKGLEMPGYEPRALPTYALGLAVCTRGACHNRAAAYDVDLRDPSRERHDEQIARDVVEAEDVAIAWDALVLCKFVRNCFDDFWREGAALYAATTGSTFEAEDLRRAARAIWRRKRAVNLKLGWTPAEDALPARFAEPLRDGQHAGARIDPAALERQRERYEDLRAGQDRGYAVASVESSIQSR